MSSLGLCQSGPYLRTDLKRCLGLFCQADGAEKKSGAQWPRLTSLEEDEPAEEIGRLDLNCRRFYVRAPIRPKSYDS